MEEIGEMIRARLPAPVIIEGDLNAKSALCCPRTDKRRRFLEEWVAELDLAVINAGRASTCVRP